MRKKNSAPEFSDHRSTVLINHFRSVIAQQSIISAAKAFKMTADAPAPRFWVSEARATRIITQLFKGVDLTEGMNSEKRKMYLEIFRRVKAIKEKSPNTPIGDIVFEVVNGPAPASYLSPVSVARIVYARRKINRNENL